MTLAKAAVLQKQTAGDKERSSVRVSLTTALYPWQAILGNRGRRCRRCTRKTECNGKGLHQMNLFLALQAGLQVVRATLEKRVSRSHRLAMWLASFERFLAIRIRDCDKR